MNKLLSAIMITISLSCSIQAVEDSRCSRIEEVKSSLELIKPKEGWSDRDEDAVKSIMEKLHYFHLTKDDSFIYWIYRQPLHLQNWYGDTVAKKQAKFYEEFINDAGKHPKYKEFSGSLRVIQLTPEQKPFLVRQKNSSGYHSDCLLYSIIREDKELLAKILGDELGGMDTAEQILATPEIVDRPLKGEEKTRDFTIVRTKILEDIKNALKDKGLSPIIKCLLKDPARGDDDKEIITYLDRIKNQSLHQEMALVISALYDLNIQVVQPSLYSLKVLNPAIKLLDGQLELYHPKGEPIYVYHRSSHYQKLFIV